MASSPANLLDKWKYGILPHAATCGVWFKGRFTVAYLMNALITSAPLFVEKQVRPWDPCCNISFCASKTRKKALKGQIRFSMKPSITKLCYCPVNSGFCVLLKKSINQSINRITFGWLRELPFTGDTDLCNTLDLRNNIFTRLLLTTHSSTWKFDRWETRPIKSSTYHLIEKSTSGHFTQSINRTNDKMTKHRSSNFIL